MSKTSLSMSVVSTIIAGAALSASPAHAHINTDGPLKDRGGDQKTPNCGGVPRSANPYVFEPGATISLGVAETIFHDGYFRISFDDDGEDDFVDPKSIDPLNPNRYGDKKCQGTAQDSCGKSDFCSVVDKDGGPTVLWDRLDPHIGPTAFLTTPLKYGWTVTLPNVECDNCTLQVMQVMEDPVGNAHGPFDGKSDLYYRCIDIQLKKGVGKTPGTVDVPQQNNGIDCLNPDNSHDGGVKDHFPKPDAGVASDDATTDGGPLGLVSGDPAVGEEESEAALASAGGCSLAPHGSARWSEGALALLMGGLLVGRSRRRRR